jgi:hypothetical protein
MMDSKRVHNMAANSRRPLLALLLFISAGCLAQTDSSSENSSDASSASSASSILSRIYLPFGYGAAFNSEPGLQTGTFVITALEYRLNVAQGLFLRFNLDNRSHAYQLPENMLTNVISGQIQFNDYAFGPGYRMGGSSLKFVGLLQGGISQVSYPVITGPINQFKIEDQTSLTPIIRATLGLEYYLDPKAALTLETGYTYSTQSSIIKRNPASLFTLSLGLTATLF